MNGMDVLEMPKVGAVGGGGPKMPGNGARRHGHVADHRDVPGAHPELQEWVVIPDSFPESAQVLPTWQARELIRQRFNDPQSDVTVLAASTGSGKTTMIGPILQPYLGPNERMIISQSRRFATRGNSIRTAEVMGVELGHEVGYQYRGDHKAGNQTQILFTVNGTLLRMLQDKNPDTRLLKGTKVVVIDEVDLPDTDIGITLALLKRVQQLRKDAKMEPLKIICMSATAQIDKLKQYFNTDKVVEIRQDNHALTKHFEQRTEPGVDPIALADMPKKAAEKVVTHLQDRDIGHGHIQIFMPGVGEIEKTIAELEKLQLGDKFEVLPLYSQLDQRLQQRIYEENGKRKIIVSTDYGKRGVTINGVNCVIDSGWVKQNEFDEESDAENLNAVKESWADVEQSAGRANRTEDGIFYLLGAKDDPDRPPAQSPEIQRSDLGNAVLTLKKSGVENVRDFDYYDEPNPANLEKAIKFLQSLGALDANEQLTPVGELMAELPLTPQEARMVVAAAQNDKGGVAEAVTMAAMLEVGDCFVRPEDNRQEADAFRKAYSTSGSDFMTILEVWEQYEKSKRDVDWKNNPKTAYLNRKKLREVGLLREQIIGILRDDNNIGITKAASREAIDANILGGFANTLMTGVNEERGFYQSAYNPSVIVYMGEKSALSSIPGEERQMIITSSIRGGQKYGRAGFNHVIPMSVAHQVVPQIVTKETTVPTYSIEHDEVRSDDIYRCGHKSEVVKMAVPDDVAREKFIFALAAGNVNVPVVKTNRKVYDDNRCTFEELMAHYDGLLSDVKNMTELQAVLERGDVDFSYAGGTVTKREAKHIEKNAETVPLESSAPEHKPNIFRRFGSFLKGIFRRQ